MAARDLVQQYHQMREMNPRNGKSQMETWFNVSDRGREGGREGEREGEREARKW